EHGERLLLVASGSSSLLPHRRDRSRKAVEHAGVEGADVDAQLECARRDDTPQPPFEQLAFDLAPLLGEVAAAIGTDELAHLGGKPSPGIGGDQFGSLAAAAERDGATVVADERRQQRGSLDVRRRACAGVLVEERRVPEREETFAAW